MRSDYKVYRYDRLDAPVVTAGSAAVLIGAQNGLFPDMGYAVPGEMGGLWAGEKKICDGFFLAVDDVPLTQADACEIHPVVTAFHYRMQKERLHVVRRQFIPDGVSGCVIELTIENLKNAPRMAEVSFTVRTDILTAAAARGGGGQDIGAHGKGHLGHARRVFEVFNRQLDHAAAHTVGNELAADDVQPLLLHAVMERGDDRVDFTGVGLRQRHVVNGQKKTVADLLFSGPKAAHFARNGVAHIRKKAVLRADEHGGAARGDDRRIQTVITINLVIAAHVSSSFYPLTTAATVFRINLISASGEISRRYFMFSSILSGMICSMYIFSGSSAPASRSFSFR